MSDEVKWVPSDEVNYMDLAEFRDFGFLQEANRLFFHPLGLALDVYITDGITTLGGVQDYRDDPEGFVFTDLTSEESLAKATTVAKEAARHIKVREDLFGNVIQPLGTTVAADDIEGPCLDGGEML